MMDWLIDTFLWTGALIGLVLLIRRPVARMFGPTMAYALWSLPFLRLFLPPITLPSWMAPAEPVAAETTFAFTVPIETASQVSLAETAATAAPISSAWFAPADLLLPLWIGGAVGFLIWRWVEYRRMKAELLIDAVPVGEDGAVQLVETNTVSSPVAFGVREKMIALPAGFIASEDRHARDLAIEHELQHHHGGDLIANFAAQALLALHWFNPLAWVGWRAMRRDQEAACDARVLEQRGGEERAAYGEVIASFAAGPRLALAAPMACPVLGEKSVIHRLRSLNMSDVSSQRRFAGKVALLAGVVALPLTASVSYAEDAVPEKVVNVVEAPQAPATAFVQAEEAPSQSKVVESADGKVEVIVVKDVDGEASKKVRKIIDKAKTGEGGESDANTFVWVSEDEGADGEKTVRTITKNRSVFINSDKKLTKEEREEIREALAEAKSEWHANGELREDIKIALAEAEGELTRISVRCGGDTPKKLKSDGNGTTVFICKSEIMASALSGLKEARKQLAEDGTLPEDAREEVLRALDEQIERFAKES